MTNPDSDSDICVNTGLRLNASNRFTSLELCKNFRRRLKNRIATGIKKNPVKGTTINVTII